MNKISEADITLTMLKPEESFDFAIDINNALKQLGYYSTIYYNRCEAQGLSYKQATDKLGEHLRAKLGLILVPKS